MGVILFLQNKKGLNNDIDFAAKTKKNLKRRFWTKQKHHTKHDWNPQKVMFFDFLIIDFKRVFLVLTVFGLFCEGRTISTFRFF